MAGADGEDTFMENSADTDVARLHYNNLRDGEILIWTPCPCDPVYFQHPMNFHVNLSTRSPNNTRHPEQSYLSQGALMKSTSLSERGMKK